MMVPSKSFLAAHKAYFGNLHDNYCNPQPVFDSPQSLFSGRKAILTIRSACPGELAKDFRGKSDLESDEVADTTKTTDTDC